MLNSDDGVRLEQVSLPRSVSLWQNHGHAWLMSQSLLAMADSAVSYECVRGSRNLAKVRVII